MWSWGLIALGGACGAVGRFALGGLINGWCNQNLDSVFPWGIWVVNILGCVLFGFLYNTLNMSATSPTLWLSQLHWSLLLLVGFCGAFTTFSTFSFDAIVLLEAQRWGLALAYILGSVLTCLCGMKLGLSMGRWFSS